MSGSEKTVKEAAAEYRAALAAIEPLKNVLEVQVKEFFKIVKAFHTDNKWYNDTKFGWVEEHYRSGFDSENISENGIYFTAHGYEDDEFLKYEEMENVSAILTREYNRYLAERKEMTDNFNARRKAELLAELETLETSD